MLHVLLLDVKFNSLIVIKKYYLKYTKFKIVIKN